MLEHPFFKSPLFGLAFIVALVLVLMLVKRLILRYLHRVAGRNHIHWDDILVHALGFPTTLLIIAAGIALLREWPLFPQDYQSPMAITSKVFFVVGFVFFFDRLFLGLFQNYSAKNPQVENYRGVVSIVLRLTIGSLGLIIFLDIIGVSITPLIASLGVGSLAVALALQDTLANFFSGVYLLIDKPIQVGQYVQLASGEEGYVDHVGWRSIRIRRLQNNMIVIPNLHIANTILTNYYLPEKELAVLVQVGVHYDSDLEAVERITIEVAKDVMKSVQGGVEAFEPFIRYHTFDSSSINFSVILRGQEYVDQFLIKHEFIKRLHKRYAEEGIEIPYPIRNIYFRNDAEAALKEAR